jgi:hypothetical protein
VTVGPRDAIRGPWLAYRFSSVAKLRKRGGPRSRGWFRIGFRKAERRWRRWNYGPAELSHLFDQLETAFQKFLHRTKEEMYEGTQMVLNITRNGEIRFRMLSDEVSF